MNVKPFKGGYDRNFSYLIYNDKIAYIVDPFEPTADYLDFCTGKEIKLAGILNTHGHFDHIGGNDSLIEKGITKLDTAEGIQIIKTPGHTQDSVCFLVDGNLFTGDTLFVGKVGGTYGEEDSKQEWNSLHELMRLPDDTIVWPGHDYGKTPTSTIGNEKKTNPFLLCNTFQEFIHLKQNWAAYKKEHNI